MPSEPPVWSAVARSSVKSASLPCWPENRGALSGKTTNPAAANNQTAATALGPESRATTSHATTSHVLEPRCNFMVRVLQSSSIRPVGCAALSTDRLVGAQQYRLGDRQVERFCRFEI